MLNRNPYTFLQIHGGVITMAVYFINPYNKCNYIISMDFPEGKD